MYHFGKRLEPAEGVEPKVGDKLTYEIIYDDGSVGTITTIVDEFDNACKSNKPQFIIGE